MWSLTQRWRFATLGTTFYMRYPWPHGFGAFPVGWRAPLDASETQIVANRHQILFREFYKRVPNPFGNESYEVVFEVAIMALCLGSGLALWFCIRSVFRSSLVNRNTTRSRRCKKVANLNHISHLGAETTLQSRDYPWQFCQLKDLAAKTTLQSKDYPWQIHQIQVTKTVGWRKNHIAIERLSLASFS